ncbi:class I SAM-dependent methyltransferase [Algoriphagus sp. NG3]|uniref:class I SAM-dependent methyltransferase n=1 Tax=Algoriphagus sp. NG3 TaxID=3097546 RepID=UPI002A7F8F02|nr:class I SAM-dependent methyltransferase [Algoriphagus sp. NG3]WPR77410.1 class I SAM-dependent methyltransferase [Algoriphagus sp. NG3]
MNQKIKIFLKNSTPAFLINFYNFFQKERKINMADLNTKEVFSKIYNENSWGSKESVSGPGSNFNQTNVMIGKLDHLFQKYNVTSILDAPCGDFNWMNLVNLEGINYLGIDIVEELVHKNKSKYSYKTGVKFRYGNIISDPLTQVDLILCRDCLVHFSFDDIKKTLNNIKRSGAKYLLTTSFTNRSKNINITTGDWRPLNLAIMPLNLGSPKEIIMEEYMGDEGRFADKSMVLWDIKSIPDKFFIYE